MINRTSCSCRFKSCIVVVLKASAASSCLLRVHTCPCRFPVVWVSARVGGHVWVVVSGHMCAGECAWVGMWVIVREWERLCECGCVNVWVCGCMRERVGVDVYVCVCVHVDVTACAWGVPHTRTFNQNGTMHMHTQCGNAFVDTCMLLNAEQYRVSFNCCCRDSIRESE